MRLGDLAFECENRQAFYRFENLLERCKVRFKSFQNTRQSLTSLCFNASVLADLFSFFISFFVVVVVGLIN